MDPNSSNSGLQTLASVLAGGLAGYVDAQNAQPVYVVQPGLQTQYGAAGYYQGAPVAAQPQVTSAATRYTPLLLIGGLVLVAALLLHRA